MFDLKPISTDNLFTVVQILIILLGFYFSWRSLESARKSVNVAFDELALGTSNAQAQLFNQMVIQGRDLQFRYAELFHGGDSQENIRVRQDHFIGALLGYYSSFFELKKMLKLPENIGRLLDADLVEVMRNKPVRDKWDEIKHLHDKDFVKYVDNVRGIA